MSEISEEGKPIQKTWITFENCPNGVPINVLGEFLTAYHDLRVIIAKSLWPDESDEFHQKAAQLNLTGFELVPDKGEKVVQEA